MGLKTNKNYHEIRKKNYRNYFLIVVAIISAIFLKFHLKKSSEKLKYWGVAIKDFSSYAPSLRTHNRVFERMNFEFVNSCGDDWDILWALEFPWNDEQTNPKFCDVENKKIQPHQKVNHFPGIFTLVSKTMMLEANSGYDFILPSFILPEEQEIFDKFIAENPQKKLLKKNFFNRGVEIIDVKNIDLNVKEIFYQEFMDDPFLIDGHAFDFGVYVLITSFDPIRVYRYSDDVLLRFCGEKYHPFDAKNPDKYVVKDGSKHVTEMPSFKENYANFLCSSKIMFENLISKKGFDVKLFWEKIDKAISKIVKNSEKDVLKTSKALNFSTRNFFELVRFDIILDKNLNPFVVEVNMSPNMTPAEKKHEENSLIYEQLIHNVVKMIGGGSYHEFWSRFDSTDEIVTNNKNLVTSLTKCIEHDCLSKCNSTYCQQCQPCMTPEIRYQLSEAFREHQNAANFERVFPLEDHFNDEKLIKKMTKNNQIQMRWFKGKCQNDKKFC